MSGGCKGLTIVHDEYHRWKPLATRTLPFVDFQSLEQTMLLSWHDLLATVERAWLSSHAG